MDKCRFAAVGMVAVCLFILVGGCAGGKKLALLNDKGITARVAVGSLDDVDYSLPYQEEDTAPQVVEVTDL
ncbi:MAG: hypothetical protein IIW47_00865, partial [Bacteroidales bacterium]|nr:hypothetical protein [Bacteroidales bacterium]